MNIPSVGVRSPLVFAFTVQLARDRQLKTIPNYINQRLSDYSKKALIITLLRYVKNNNFVCGV